jgi:molybdopterin/thiamine biosynthesis adenylyltransferase
MIKNIVEHLRLCGFNASIENNRIVTIHSCNDNEFTVVGEIAPMSDRQLPLLFLRDRSKYGSLAHIGWDNMNINDEGLICEGIAVNRHIDYANPHIVYKKALEQAVKIIIHDLSDTENNKQEILKEFTAHWRHATLSEKYKVISFIEPGTLIEEIEVYNPISPSHRNFPFLIKGQAGHINKEYEYLRKLIKGSQSKGKAIYLPIDFSLLPPNPTTKLLDWWLDLVDKLSWKVKNQLKDIARRNRSHNFWVLGSVKLKEDYRGWFCIFFSNTNKQIPPLFNHSDIATWKAIAYNVKIHSKEYIVPRGGSTLYKKENTLAVVGCGSVGAEIARQLASSGINNLLLVDPDELSIENIYRHFLGPEYIEGKKSIELALDLKKRYPYTNATVTPQKNLESCLVGDFLSSVDGIIVATGSPTEERFFNEELFKLDNRPWVVYCWVEGHGVGGHAVYVHSSGKGCLNCLYRDSDGNKSLESICNFLKSQQDIAIDIAGCGTHFLPYSFTDAIQTAILATRLSLLAIENKLPESCRISWKNCHANEMGLKTSYRYKTFDDSLNIEPLYWENCDVCNE